MKRLSFYAATVILIFGIIFTTKWQFHIAKLWYQDKSYHKDYEKEIYLPQKMLPYLNEFEQMAALAGVKTNKHPLLVVFEPTLLERGIAGVCFTPEIGGQFRIIMLASEYQNDELMQKYVLFHELAHCRADVTVHQGKFGHMFSQFVWRVKTEKQFLIHAADMFDYLRYQQSRR